MAKYRTLAEWEGLTGDDALTDPEHELINHCRAGTRCILGDGTRPDGPDPARTIRAGLLRYLILGGCDACKPDEAGVQLEGAYIPDPLTLDFATAKGQTFLVRCSFADEISALQTSFELLNLSGSALPGLNAQGSDVTGAVFLRDGFHASGKVSLSSAKIGGQLSCIKGRFDNEGGDALNA
ncbi:MAG: hypothetical protein WBH14_08390, partial [Albidovulum sp.]